MAAGRLRSRGAILPDSVTSGARSLTTQDLGYEIARYVFGRPVEFRRRMSNDRQVQQALALARRAKTPADLLVLAAGQTSGPTHN